MLHSKYNREVTSNQDKREPHPLSVIAFLIGMALIIVQITITKNTIDNLTINLPSIIGLSIFALFILFECCKPLLITLFRNTIGYLQRLAISALLIALSSMSIFAVHSTVSTAASNLTDAQKIEIESLNTEKEAYLSAVSKGVITASQKRLDEITLRQKQIVSSQTDITSSNQLWAKVVSYMTELMIITCFFMSSVFNTSNNKVKSNEGGETNNDKDDNHHTDKKEVSHLSVIDNHNLSQNNSSIRTPNITCDPHTSSNDDRSDIEIKIHNALIQLNNQGCKISKASVAEFIGIRREYLYRQYSNEYERAISLQSHIH
ncbi:hypothetical protein [Shewanella surugensis]|uniref:Uncharacterized protein n=1 Tax=Shewanella surugensis TaxID=212020 RepID=A0ABT0LGK6_9GAMM|nr:hypothetical protein [Shewanella surugensis]MCL1126818.1 hypothetical protein [Shewanella surugensis]